jgi:hypothetical protein
MSKGKKEVKEKLKEIQEQLDCWVKGDTYLNWLKSDE